LPLCSLQAQSGAAGESDLLEQQNRKDTLKNLALESISQGKFREALTYLDSAIALAPSEKELQDLRQSVQDILILSEGKTGTGDAVVSDPDFSQLYKPEENSDKVISPDFARELLTESQKEDPTVNRNHFSLSVGVRSGLTQPVRIFGDVILPQNESTPVHPFSRLSGEAQYFFDESKRRFGVAARYKGTISNQDNIDMLVQQFDVTMHYRSFFAETMESRLILGVKAGIGYLFLNETDKVGKISYISHSTILTGLYFEDAIFRYLFKKHPFFNKILLDMNFDFYFLSTLDNMSMAQFSIGGGYRFSPHFSFHIFNELFNSTNDFQNSNSWEVGARLKYRY